MHPDEVRATTEQVNLLLANQFPQWRELTVQMLDREGTDHVLFRLGNGLLIRMPKIARATRQVETDRRWLPLLERHLPAPIPAPVAIGAPAAGYPWKWTVVPWLDGTNPTDSDCVSRDFALDVGSFVRTLHATDPMGGPLKTGNQRGTPISQHADAGRRAIDRIQESGYDDGFDIRSALAAWEDSVAAPDWPNPPVWLHGDLQPGNLLIRDGRLTGVIDFGDLGLGDPAPDLACMFWTFTGEASDVYRRVLGYDEATRRRARGWAMLPSLNGIDYYRASAPAMAAHGRETVRRCIADYERPTETTCAARVDHQRLK